MTCMQEAHKSENYSVKT